MLHTHTQPEVCGPWGDSARTQRVEALAASIEAVVGPTQWARAAASTLISTAGSLDTAIGLCQYDEAREVASVLMTYQRLLIEAGRTPEDRRLALLESAERVEARAAKQERRGNEVGAAAAREYAAGLRAEAAGVVVVAKRVAA